MARDYAKISPRFWIGETGRKIRNNRSAQVLATYLITAPGSTMIGIYYLPLPVVAHETGMSGTELTDALSFLADVDFAHYDGGHEFVWVPSMAEWQIDDHLKPGDKRVLGVRRELEALRGHPFVGQFWGRYGDAFSLGPAPVARPIQAPSKALPSHEQDQDQDHGVVSVSSPPVLEASGPDQTRGIPLPQAPYLAPRDRPRVDRFAAATSGEFDRVYSAYPRKDAMVRAQDEFQRQAAVSQGGEKGLADAILAALPAMLKRAPYNGPNDKRPYLETVLLERRWEDRVSAPDDAPSAKANGPPRDRRTGHARAEDQVHTKSGEVEV